LAFIRQNRNKLKLYTLTPKSFQKGHLEAGAGVTITKIEIAINQTIDMHKIITIAIITEETIIEIQGLEITIDMSHKETNKAGLVKKIITERSE